MDSSSDFDLEFRNVTKLFGDVRAVDDATFQVRRAIAARVGRSARRDLLALLNQRGWVKVVLFLAPACLLLMFYLVIPIVMLIVMSFYRSTLFGVVPDFSWNNYLHFWRNP